MKVGDKVDILCQSKDPAKISGMNPAKTGAIFIGLGALVAVVACGSVVRIFIRRR